jgi:hypothetical protein
MKKAVNMEHIILKQNLNSYYNYLSYNFFKLRPNYDSVCINDL